MGLSASEDCLALFCAADGLRLPGREVDMFYTFRSGHRAVRIGAERCWTKPPRCGRLAGSYAAAPVTAKCRACDALLKLEILDVISENAPRGRFRENLVLKMRIECGWAAGAP